MQKEQLSALMDGELIDSALIGSLSKNDELQQYWHRYHLIRDSLRGDIGQHMHVDIADKVFAAIVGDPNINHIDLHQVTMIPSRSISESQPQPDTWRTLSFWDKVKPWFNHIGQVGLAASISLAVIVGVQQYNNEDPAVAEVPVFNTFSIGNLASPVSYGLSTNTNAEQSGVQDHRRHFAILQDYELQRRLHADSLRLKEINKGDQTLPNKRIEAINN